MMPQMPSREKLLAWIDQVSFAVVEMNLYLDTHPEDEPFFRMGYAAMAVGSQPERRVLTDVEL